MSYVKKLVSKKISFSKKRADRSPLFLFSLISTKLEILVVSDVSRSAHCAVKGKIKRLPAVPVRVLLRLFIGNIKSTNCDAGIPWKLISNLEVPLHVAAYSVITATIVLVLT